MLCNIIIFIQVPGLLHRLLALPGDTQTLSFGKEDFRLASPGTEGHKSPTLSLRECTVCAASGAAVNFPARGPYSCSCQIAEHAWHTFISLMLMFILDLSLAAMGTQLLTTNVT